MKYNQLPQNGTGAPSGAPTHGALARDPGGQPGGRRWCFRTTLSCSASTGGVFERVHRDASEQKKRQGIYIYLDPPKGILFKPLLEKAPFAHQERFLQVEAFLEIPWFGDLEPFISSWNM